MLISWGSVHAVEDARETSCTVPPVIKNSDCKKAVSANGSLIRTCFNAAKCGTAGLTSVACGFFAIAFGLYGGNLLVRKHSFRAGVVGSLPPLGLSAALAYTAWDTFDYSTQVFKSLMHQKINE